MLVLVCLSDEPGDNCPTAWAISGVGQATLRRLPSDCFDNKTEYNGEDGDGVTVYWPPTMKEYLLKNSRVQIL